MSVNPLDAAAAYTNTANVKGTQGASQNKVGGASFADVMKAGVEKVVQTQYASEQMSARAITGEAELIDVVTAVNAAESTLQTAVAIRDRMVEAYQAILRMPI